MTEDAFDLPDMDELTRQMEDAMAAPASECIGGSTHRGGHSGDLILTLYKLLKFMLSMVC